MSIVHTYYSMQNPKYGDSRNLYPMILKLFLYVSSHPQENTSFKGISENILLDLLTNRGQIKKIHI